MRNWKCFLVGFATIAVPMGATGPAHADARAVAEALFRDGTQLLTAGRVEEACPKLAESQKLDPALGTLFYLAACHEKQGLTASAWSEFSSATAWAQRTNQPERAAFGRKHLAQLEANLTTIVLSADRIPGLELRVDDGLLSAAAIGTPLPVDPGSHTIEAKAPGFQPWRTAIEVPPDAQQLTVTVPPLVAAGAAAPRSAEPTAPSPTHSSVSHREPADNSDSHVLLWTTAGVAVAGIVAGSVFGVLTFGIRDRAIAECPGNVCGPGGLNDIDRAKTYATIATVGFGVGLLGAAATGYLWLRIHGSTGHGQSAGGPSLFVSPILSPSGAGFALTAPIQ
jgi:hypothetical protein